MFFGAGNLIYPIFIGSQSLGNFFYGILGITATGILLPLLGLISICLYKGDINKFFHEIGEKPGDALIIIILLIIGPIAAIPRCILVSFNGFRLIFEGANFTYFNLVFCIATGLLVVKKTKVVEIIGKWFTPLLIFGVFTIIGAGLYADKAILHSSSSPVEIFKFAALEGYHTMDMCAAFFFAKIIIDYMKNVFSENKNVMKNTVVSSVIGISILAVVYACLLYIGAKYSIELSGIPKSGVLVEVSKQLLGKFALPIASITIIIACTTTVIALNELIAEWLSQKFKLDMNATLILLVFSSFMSATVGFDNIAITLGKVLYYVYPALISLALCNTIGYFNHRLRIIIKPVFWATIVINLITA